GSEFLGKLRQETLSGPRASLSKRANRASRNVIRHALESVRVARPALPAEHSRGYFRHPDTSLRARGALSATLIGIKLIQVIEHPNHIAGVVHHHHAAA